MSPSRSSRRVFTLLLAFCLFQLPMVSAEAQTAPGFSLSTANHSIDLQDYRGKVIYLDFWASWCSPCRASFPWMNSLHQKYADQGLVVLAVNLDKKQTDARRFLDKYPADFTVAFDPQGDVAELYNLKGMPSSYLIDRHGNLVLSHVGFRHKDSEQLESHIKQQLHQ